ncbi:MAG TPA: cation transporter [Nocardioidaceae bacterium]|nr:cation transporter [Nocardioidaceae bacterium]
MTTSSYAVAGMTCGHCVNAVTEEVKRLDGVSAVDVDLNAGGVSRLTVTSTQPVSVEAVAAAVDEAGYELAGQG